MALAAALLGLLFGSFAALVAWRLPRGEGLAGGRSRCRDCGRNLAAIDLVPLLSYIVQRGRCRQCGAAVPLSYPMIEAATGILFVLVFWGVGATPVAIPLGLLAAGLVILVAIDLEHMIIPDPLSLALGALGLVYRAMTSDTMLPLWDAAIGALAGFGIAWLLRFVFQRLKHREALGFGDVKFFAVAGIWCGLSGLADFMMLSGLSGIVFAGVWRWRGGNAEFPFGPALAAGLFAVVMLQAAGLPHPLDLLMIR